MKRKVSGEYDIIGEGEDYLVNNNNELIQWRRKNIKLLNNKRTVRLRRRDGITQRYHVGRKRKAKMALPLNKLGDVMGIVKYKDNDIAVTKYRGHINSYVEFPETKGHIPNKTFDKHIDGVRVVGFDTAHVHNEDMTPTELKQDAISQAKDAIDFLDSNPKFIKYNENYDLLRTLPQSRTSNRRRDGGRKRKAHTRIYIDGIGKDKYKQIDLPDNTITIKGTTIKPNLQFEYGRQDDWADKPKLILASEELTEETREKPSLFTTGGIYTREVPIDTYGKSFDVSYIKPAFSIKENSSYIRKKQLEHLKKNVHL